MTEVDELARRVALRRRELDSLSGEARSTLTRGKALQDEVAELGEQLTDFDKVTGFLNSLGEDRQLKAQSAIEHLVTRGLQTIFDDSLSFHIVQSVKGKAANVDFLVRTTLPGSVVETPVMDARGGGLAATIGFLLRVVVMLLAQGTKKENILVLDESFAMVSEDYLAPLGEFLRELVDKTGIQIIMVSHQDIWVDVADKVYKFTMNNGQTVVTEGA